MKPRLRKAFALKALCRLKEAETEFREVLCMEPICTEAKKGLKECQALKSNTKGSLQKTKWKFFMAFAMKGGL